MIARTSRRMKLCLCTLIFLLAFIWGNSLLPGHISGALSDGVRDLLSRIFPFLLDPNPDSAGDGLLRKIAHFSEFTALGICLCWLFAMLRRQFLDQITLSAAYGCLAACADEAIQRFVPDRHGCLTDVAIDSSGVITGIVLFLVGYHLYRNRHPRQTDG